jgi:hypothetical protein
MHDTMALRPENEDEEGRETKYSRRYQAHLNFANFSSLRIRLNRGDVRTISVRHKACPTRSQGDRGVIIVIAEVNSGFYSSFTEEESITPR